MKILEEKATGYIILIITFISGIIVILTTFNSFGGADNYSHYLLAHWGWKYPELLFDHWGKPVYTILSSPFAQFGMNGSRFFNLITGLATAFFIWKTAIKLKIKNHVLALIFVIFTPIYFSLMFASLTEVLFSLFLALAIYLFFHDKYIWSAIVISFIPIVRTEGIVLIPLFWMAYAFKREFLAIVFTLTGFFFVSTAGYFFMDEYWWLITKMPYKGGTEDIYGSGSLLHFVNDSRGIFGYPIAYMLLIGLLISIYNWTIKDKFRMKTSFFFFLLIVGSFVVFFSAHSYVWWKGVGNSLGLIRVIGSVTPLVALIALPAFNLIIYLIGKIHKPTSLVILSGLSIWIIILGFNTHRKGFKPGREQNEILKAAEYIKENNLHKHKIHYFNPFLITALDIDPYNHSTSGKGVINKENPSTSIADSSIILWDGHFGPNEGRLPLINLLNDKNLELIKTITPTEYFTTLGGNNYCIHIFRKTPKIVDLSNSKLELNIDPNLKVVSKKSDSCDVYFASSKNKYINLLKTKFKNFNFESSLSITTTFSGNLKFSDINKPPTLVCSVTKGDKTILYQAIKLINSECKNNNTWYFISESISILPPNDPESDFNLYIWNSEETDFFLSDLQVKLIFDTSVRNSYFISYK